MDFTSHNTIELHYFFTDAEHKIDAIIQNRCEHEFLSVIKELSKCFDIEYQIETELTQPGGLKKYFKLKPKTNSLTNKEKKKIQVNVRTAILTTLITTIMINPLATGINTAVKNFIDGFSKDTEMSELEKEKIKQEIKSLELDNTIKQQKINENTQLEIYRSNFYELLNNYNRIKSIQFINEDENKNIWKTNPKIQKEQFNDYIIQKENLEDEFIENAKIIIVSPVLNKNAKIKWQGYYNGELIKLTMKSDEFKTSVDDGLIEFKNGFIITCNLRIEREKKNGEIEKKRYIVTEVLNYIIDDKVLETIEGKNYKAIKAAEKAQQVLPFEEFKNSGNE